MTNLALGIDPFYPINEISQVFVVFFRAILLSGHVLFYLIRRSPASR